MIDAAAEQIEELIARLGSPSARDREMATLVLARSGREAVPLLLTALHSPEWGVRKQAAAAFAEAPDPRAVPHLSELSNDVDWEVRLEAVNALRAAADPRSAGALLARLNDGHPRVRALAAEALTAIAEDGHLDGISLDHLREAFTSCCAALRYEDPRVRCAAARLLGHLGDPRAVAPLWALLTSETDAPALAAVEALGRLGRSEALEALRVAVSYRNADIAALAIEGIANIGGSEAAGYLVSALGYRHAQVRRAAALGLTRMAEIAPQPAMLRGVSPLRKLARVTAWGDPDREVYARALQAINSASADSLKLPLPARSDVHREALPLPSVQNTASNPEGLASGKGSRSSCWGRFRDRFLGWTVLGGEE
jgi:HEAT repeat protein